MAKAKKKAASKSKADKMPTTKTHKPMSQR